MKPEQHFRLADGRTISTLEELSRLLKDVPAQAFGYHVTPEKNDFANWIRMVFRQPRLADKVASARTPVAMSQAIEDFLMLNPQQVLELVTACRYEDALGIGIAAPLFQVDKAVIHLSRKYGDNVEVKQNLNKAAAQLRAERNRPHDTGIRCRNVGVQLSRGGNKKDSLPYLQKAVEVCGEWDDYHWLGSTLVQAGKHREALPYLEKAVSMHDGKDEHGWLQTARQALAPKTQQTVTVAQPIYYAKPTFPFPKDLATLFDPNDPDAMQQMLDLCKNDPQMSKTILDMYKTHVFSQPDFRSLTDISPNFKLSQFYLKVSLFDRIIGYPLAWLGDILDWFRSGTGRKVVKVTGIVLLVVGGLIAISVAGARSIWAVVAALLVMGWLSRR